MVGRIKEITDDIIIKTIMNNSEDTIYFKDRNSKIIVSSRAHALLWGEKNNENIIGKSDFDYFPYEFAMMAFKDEKKIMETGIPLIGTCERLVKEDGSVMWLSASKYPLYDKNDKIIGTWGTSRDITDLKTAEEELIEVNKKLEETNNKLQILSSKDCLSGLFNQRYFFKELSTRLEQNKRIKEKSLKEDFSLILFDIDNFKNVNDKYGHLMGDFTIRHIANLIRDNVRVGDTCFRYGGDEFAVILTDTNLKEARKVAEKLRRKIEDSSIRFNDKETELTISIGVAHANEAKDIDEIIKLADQRLYKAKNKGKNKVC